MRSSLSLCLLVISFSSLVYNKIFHCIIYIISIYIDMNINVKL
nr:MAG TPA: hypothetical protein [Caudoviricetes sp.]